MQLLERVHLVQFFLFEAQTLRLDATTAIIAPNGAGKSALLDALQIVLLGGDRGRIRFNAQAGGSHRARTIRDYCLGTYRSGEDGRKRRTATTYISLVFRDRASGTPLTAGIALGASVDEPEHRVHGMYLLPGVALELDEHLERAGGRELPLAWASFRELAVRRCRKTGTGIELHTTSERFVRDLLLRLRAAPGLHPDVHAYRKAFQNALNLQKQDDIDLWVRTLVAEDRPTDIARFRGLLDTFRQIKERIEQLAQRIEAAEGVERQYARVAAHAVRAASYRALGAEYARDLLEEQVVTAEGALEAARAREAAVGRELEGVRADRDLAREDYERANARLQGSAGYGEQARFDELAGRDREQLQRLQRELLAEISFVRERLRDIGRLELPTIDATALRNAGAAWDGWYEVLAGLPGDAALPWTPEALHAQAQQALAAAGPLVAAVEGHARECRAAFEKAGERLATARLNQKRLAAGQAELHPDVGRLMGYLQDAGIAARPVCDLVRVTDTAWQGTIEAYLRSNVEALLVPLEDEERAVKLYRSLQGGRAVYGVKLALPSQARAMRERGEPAPDSVAALLDGADADAVAFLRRQLGDLRRVETEAELVGSRRGLSRDGVLAKGGSIERLRPVAAAEWKIGASDNRARARAQREELAAAEAEVRRMEPGVQRAEACQRGLARLAADGGFAQALHDRALEHRKLEQRYRSAREGRDAGADPDLVRMGEAVRELKALIDAGETRIEQLAGDAREAANVAKQSAEQLAWLGAQVELAARRAVEAFGDPDVNPNRVERQREELDGKHPALEERKQRCEERAADALGRLQRALPDAWSALSQYAKDHHLELEFAPDQWRPAHALMESQLDHLRGTELVRYQGQAAQAYDTAVETFRSNVASALYDNFSRLREQITTLNRTLRNSPAFSNNERYRFHFEVLPEFRDLYNFIKRATDLGAEDGLFGSAGEVPPAFREMIEDSAALRGAAASPLDDYRRFFRFEVQIQQDDRVIGTLSERMRSGSGGEHRAPLYVIAGAALAAAYGKSDAHPGGLGLILLDEFGDKIDAQNARATTNYLRSLGLQLVLAAPDTAQGTLSGVLDSYIELFRDDDLVQVEHVEVTEAARELLRSDQFDLHPELLADEAARIARERSPA